MAHFCFVSYEFAPFTPGGVGTFITSITRQLLKDGHSVTLLLDIDYGTYENINNQLKNQYFESNNLNLYHVESIVDSNKYFRNNFPSDAHWKSYIFSLAVLNVHNTKPIDILEFVDYCGAAYYTLVLKQINPHLLPAKILIRMHNTIELIDMCAKSNFNPNRIFDYYLERTAIALSDFIISPGIRYWDDVAAYLYNKPKENIFICPPVRSSLPKVCDSSTGQNIIFLGRISTIKGMDLFLQVMSLICNDNELSNKFDNIVIIGPNESVATQDEQLIIDQGRNIPKNKIHFKGRLSESEILDEFSRAKFAVFPNKCESFCYAAHEAYLAGVPILVSSSPAYIDHFEDRKNALFYNNSLSGLFDGVKELILNSILRETLSSSVDQYRGRYNEHGYHDVISTDVGIFQSLDIKNNLFDLTIIYFCNGTSIDDDPLLMLNKFIASISEINVNIIVFVRNSKHGYFHAFGDRWDIHGGDSSSSIIVGNNLLFLVDGSQVSATFIVRALTLMQNEKRIGVILPVSVNHLIKAPIFGSAAILFGSGLNAHHGVCSAVIRTNPGMTIYEVFEDYTSCTEISLILNKRSNGYLVVDDIEPGLFQNKDFFSKNLFRKDIPDFLKRHSHYFHSVELATQLSMQLQSNEYDFNQGSERCARLSWLGFEYLMNPNCHDRVTICVQEGVVSLFSILCNISKETINLDEIEIDDNWKFEFAPDRITGFLTGSSGAVASFNAPNGAVLNLSLGPTCKYVTIINRNRAVTLDAQNSVFSNFVFDTNNIFNLLEVDAFDFPPPCIKINSLLLAAPLPTTHESSSVFSDRIFFYANKNEQSYVLAKSLNENLIPFFIDPESLVGCDVVDRVASICFSNGIKKGVFYGSEWITFIPKILEKFKYISVLLFISPNSVWSCDELNNIVKIKKYLSIYKDRFYLNYSPSLMQIFDKVDNTQCYTFRTFANKFDFQLPVLQDGFSIIIDRCPVGMDYMGHLCAIVKILSCSNFKISRIYIPENQSPQELIFEALGINYSLFYYNNIVDCIQDLSSSNFLFLNPFPFGFMIENKIIAINSGGLVILSPYEFSLLGQPDSLGELVVDFWEDVDLVSNKIKLFYL